MKTLSQVELPGSLGPARRGLHLDVFVRVALCAALGALFPFVGCGTPGAPQPPSLKLPQPPADLAATRSGDAVSLHWTMPRRATDQVLLSGDQRTVVCRAVGTAPCTPVAALLLQAGAPGAYTDELPAGLTAGPPQLLRYTILLQNRQHTGAGPSNVAYAAAGAAPPPVAGLQAAAEARGIVLSFEPALPASAGGAALFPVEHGLRLRRTRLAGPGQGAAPAKGEISAGVAQPAEQTLEIGSPGSPPPQPSMAVGWTRSEAVDKDARLNCTYRYTVERVARIVLDGHPLEVTSGPSAPVLIDARDLFPPAVPAAVEAVADAEGSAVDVSWSPDADADLAGYVVYRRVAGQGRPERVSGPAWIVDPAWRDKDVRPGLHYAYSVSAVDASGNESARSLEAEEFLPPAEPK